MTDLPRPSAEPAPLPSPEDTAYHGTLELTVDATDVARGIFRAHERIPVRGGERLTLFYPKWLPGYHAPQSPIAFLAGLELHANGQRIAWRRDELEVYAFHVDVPAGAEALDATFQFVSPTCPAQGRVAVSTDLLNLQWNTVILYPAGHYARRIQVAAGVKLPEHWGYGSALSGTTGGDGVVRFAPVPLDVLVDSPLFAGRHYRAVDLEEGGAVRLNLVADRPDMLEATEEQLAPHKELVAQADELFGPRPFTRYDFLVALTDELGELGCEHHRSTEIKTVSSYFTEWERNAPSRDVMSHEYTHAWNGKFRRGADSWTASFDQPIRNSLMWVYEGQTQYWGNILSTRSGLWTLQQALESLARTAATFENRAGRRWRPMSDTTRDPVITGRSPLPWLSWQRSEDYYSEGQLLWLDVDTRIRELSGDRRSLDDFARRFFGKARGGDAPTSTYDFAEVVATLEAVQPFDWATLLRDKLDSTAGESVLDGIERGGYRLVYKDEPSAFGEDADALFDVESLKFSIGLSVDAEGQIKEVLWESPAFAAGLTAGAALLAVNGRAFSAKELKRAVLNAQDHTPIELLIKRGKHHAMVQVAYHGGLRYPHLEPIEGQRLRLDEIYARR